MFFHSTTTIPPSIATPITPHTVVACIIDAPPLCPDAEDPVVTLALGFLVPLNVR